MTRNPTPGHVPRQNYNSKRYMHPSGLCTTWVLFTIAKTWFKETTRECIKVHQQVMDKENMTYLYTVESYSAIKNKTTERVLFATT